MNTCDESFNWYTFASKLNSFLIDKGYKMEYSNNYRQFLLGDIPYFIINYDDQLIHFNKDLYSRWYMMDIDEFDFELLEKCADEILTQYKQEIYVNKLLKVQDDF